MQMTSFVADKSLLQQLLGIPKCPERPKFSGLPEQLFLFKNPHHEDDAELCCPFTTLPCKAAAMAFISPFDTRIHNNIESPRLCKASQSTVVGIAPLHSSLITHSRCFFILSPGTSRHRTNHLQRHGTLTLPLSQSIDSMCF